MNELNYISNLVTQIMKLDRGSYIENQFVFDYDSSAFTINILRTHSGSRIKAQKKSRFNISEELYQISFDIHNTGEYDSPSACRYIEQSDETALVVLIQNENDWIYKLKTNSGDLTFREETIHEDHFQFSTMQDVPVIETCFDVIKHRNSVHNSIREMGVEFGIVIRMNVRNTLTKKDADLLYNYIPSFVDMVTTNL